MHRQLLPILLMALLVVGCQGVVPAAGEPSIVPATPTEAEAPVTSTPTPASIPPTKAATDIPSPTAEPIAEATTAPTPDATGAALRFADEPTPLDITVADSGLIEADPSGRYVVIRVPDAMQAEGDVSPYRLQVLDTNSGATWDVKGYSPMYPPQSAWTPDSRLFWLDGPNGFLAAADGSGRQSFPAPEELMDVVTTTNEVAIARSESGALYRVDLATGQWDSILPAPNGVAYERVVSPNDDSLILLDHQGARIVSVPLTTNGPIEEIGPLTPFVHPGGDDPNMPVAYTLADSPYILPSQIMDESTGTFHYVAIDAITGELEPLPTLVGLDDQAQLDSVSDDLRWVAFNTTPSDLPTSYIAPSTGLIQGFTTAGRPIAWLPDGVVLVASTGDTLFITFRTLSSGEEMLLLQGMPLTGYPSAAVGDGYVAVQTYGGSSAYDLEGNGLGYIPLPAYGRTLDLAEPVPMVWATAPDHVLLVAGTSDTDPTPRLWSWAITR